MLYCRIMYGLKTWILKFNKCHTTLVCGISKAKRAAWNTSEIHTLKRYHYYIFLFAFEAKIFPKAEISMVKVSPKHAAQNNNPFEIWRQFIRHVCLESPTRLSGIASIVVRPKLFTHCLAPAIIEIFLFQPLSKKIKKTNDSQNGKC